MIELSPIIKELRAILTTKRGELLRQEYKLIDSATNELELAAGLIKTRIMAKAGEIGPREAKNTFLEL
jgi:hypothetical protein